MYITVFIHSERWFQIIAFTHFAQASYLQSHVKYACLVGTARTNLIGDGGPG
jgi:hypothetical protein